MLTHLLQALFGTRSPTELARSTQARWEPWLKAIKPDAPVGSDPICDDDFLLIKEEVIKLSGINDSLIIDTAERLLKTRAKDVRLAVYYLYARTRRDGAQGVADGFELLSALIERFGQTLLPQREKTRKSALEWLAGQTFTECLDRVGDLDQGVLERSLSALALMIESTMAWPEESRPCLDPLSRRFESYFEDPRRTHTPSENAGAGSDPQAVGGHGTPSESGDAYGAGATSASTPVLSSAVSAAAVLGSPSDVSSTRALLEQTRRMTQFLRDQPDGYLPAYRLIRCIRWDTVNGVPPHDVSGKTRLLPPRAELRAHLTRLLLQKQWQELLGAVEAAFMEGVNHFWLDLQRFAFIAQEQEGGEFARVRDFLATDCAQMLTRLPGLDQLAFSDGSAFADDATLDWINTYATVRELEHGVTAEPVATVCAETDWGDAEAHAMTLATTQGLDVALVSLRDKATHRGARDRFILHRVMARVAEQADRGDMAAYLLTDLDGLIEQHKLTTWEPSLAFETKHHLLQLLRSEVGRVERGKATGRGAAGVGAGTRFDESLTRNDSQQHRSRFSGKESDRDNGAAAAALLQRIEALRAALTTIDAARAATLI